MKYIENQEQIEELTEKFNQIIRDIKSAFDSNDIKEQYASYLTNRLNKMYVEIFENIGFEKKEEIKAIKEYIESDFNSLINNIMKYTEEGEITRFAQEVFCKKIQTLKENVLDARKEDNGIRTHYEVDEKKAIENVREKQREEKQGELGPILE